MGVTAPPGWWRGRRWRCINCEHEFVLERPHRVTDMRGFIVDAQFRCPACGRVNPVTRRKLDHYEGLAEPT